MYASEQRIRHRCNCAHDSNFNDPVLNGFYESNVKYCLVKSVHGIYTTVEVIFIISLRIFHMC